MNEELKDKIWNGKSWLFDTEAHPEIPDKMERMCVILREEDYSYGNIQRFMGNPSKHWIRETLLKWAPELINK